MCFILCLISFTAGAVAAILFPYVRAKATLLADKVKAWYAKD